MAFRENVTERSHTFSPFGNRANQNHMNPTAVRGVATRWGELADAVLAGHSITRDEGIALLRSDDRELLDVLAAAYRVRYRWHGNRMHLNLLLNAKSGICSEDCGYCSQSRVSSAGIPKYRLVDRETILAGARLAVERKARTYCIVISGRAPTEEELSVLASVVPEIKARHPLAVCVCPGLLRPEQAARLAAAGVNRVNHNLNTSERFYPSICSTHAYADRLATLRAVRAAGMEICSGGIVGMGETDEDVVDLALTLGALEVEATPVNFFLPIPGVPLAHGQKVDPRYALKVLVLFRLANPKCELRVAAGREVHLGPLQPLALFAANSIFVGDYLTTRGQAPEDDYRMIEALGFEPVIHGMEA